MAIGVFFCFCLIYSPLVFFVFNITDVVSNADIRLGSSKTNKYPHCIVTTSISYNDDTSNMIAILSVRLLGQGIGFVEVVLWLPPFISHHYGTFMVLLLPGKSGDQRPRGLVPGTGVSLQSCTVFL